MGAPETIATILDAAADYRIADYERCLALACEQLPAHELVQDVLAPVLREAGNRWHRGELSIVQEHMLSSAVRRQLFDALDRYGRSGAGPGIAFTTLSGERHELGSLMLAVVAASRGFRALYLGADLPAEEVGRFCGRVAVLAVAVSIVTTPEVVDVRSQLATLRAVLPEGVEIWVGGYAANRLNVAELPARSFLMKNMQQFQARLAALGGGSQKA